MILHSAVGAGVASEQCFFIGLPKVKHKYHDVSSLLTLSSPNYLNLNTNLPYMFKIERLLPTDMSIKHAAWTHGLGVELETTTWSALRQGFYTTVRPDGSLFGWVHFVIPTPGKLLPILK
jgi:hypothetical protein